MWQPGMKPRGDTAKRGLGSITLTNWSILPGSAGGRGSGLILCGALPTPGQTRERSAQPWIVGELTCSQSFLASALGTAGFLLWGLPVHCRVLLPARCH